MRCEVINNVLSVSDVGGVHGNKSSESVEVFYRKMLYAINSVAYKNATHIIVVLTPSTQGLEESYLSKLGFSKHETYYPFICVFIKPIEEFLEIQNKEQFAAELKGYAERVKQRELKDLEEGRTGPTDIRVGDTVEFYTSLHHIGTVVSVSTHGIEVQLVGHTYPTSYNRNRYAMRRVDVE